MLLTKYGIDQANLPLALPMRNGSHSWKYIGKIWHETLLGARWNIGDGRRVRLWWDCWVTKNQPLIFFAIVPVPESIINKVAARFADGNGNWQWDGFSHLRPNNILFRIALFQPPMRNKGGDQVYWAKSNKGIITVKSAYNVISNTQNRDEDKSWDIVWLWKGPKSIRTFL